MGWWMVTSVGKLKADKGTITGGEIRGLVRYSVSIRLTRGCLVAWSLTRSSIGIYTSKALRLCTYPIYLLVLTYSGLEHNFAEQASKAHPISPLTAANMSDDDDFMQASDEEKYVGTR